MKKVLLFNISSIEEQKNIRKALLPLNIAVLSVAKEEYFQSLGFLSGNKQMPKTDALYSGEELEGQMMLMCGIFGDTMEKTLSALKKAGACKDCLKAILTATNSAWTAPQLYEELKKEHELMKKRM